MRGHQNIAEAIIRGYLKDDIYDHVLMENYWEKYKSILTAYDKDHHDGIGLLLLDLMQITGNYKLPNIVDFVNTYKNVIGLDIKAEKIFDESGKVIGYRLTVNYGEEPNQGSYTTEYTEGVLVSNGRYLSLENIESYLRQAGLI